MKPQTDLFTPPRTTYLVVPAKDSDRRAYRERYGTDRLYEGPEEEHARIALHHNSMCARVPTIMAERRPDGRIGRIVHEAAFRRKPCRPAV